MINEGVAVLAIAATIIAAAICAMPRCPECGWLRTVPNDIDPGLRHCRRCLTVFRPGRR